MSKTDSKPKKQIQTFVPPNNVPAKSQMHCPVVKQNSPPALQNTSSREVMALDAKYSDLLKPKASPFDFKSHALPVLAIFVFSLVLVVLFHFTGRVPAPDKTRGVSGDLNDLSSGQYVNQSADYETEKVCIDNSDGTQSCTTKTKLRRSFR